MTTPPSNAGSGQGEAGEVSAREQVLTSLSLVYYPNPILRALCQPVELFDSTLNDLVQEMFALMTLREGIGLAGPQVSIDQRVLVCAIQGRQLCLTNPEIIEADTPAEAIEGCLSLPNIQVTVRRPERIQVSGYDTDGRKVRLGATGLWARVIQHELDHLNGVLICDRTHLSGESCEQCPLALPAVLVEERKHKSRSPRA